MSSVRSDARRATVFEFKDEHDSSEHPTPNTQYPIPNPMAEYSVMIRDLPAEQRPRERLAAHGPQALTAQELLALLLRSGTAQESVIRMAERLLAHFGTLKGVATATFDE